jgi:hypothetical protein
MQLQLRRATKALHQAKMLLLRHCAVEFCLQIFAEQQRDLRAEIQQ